VNKDADIILSHLSSTHLAFVHYGNSWIHLCHTDFSSSMTKRHVYFLAFISNQHNTHVHV